MHCFIIDCDDTFMPHTIAPSQKASQIIIFKPHSILQLADALNMVSNTAIHNTLLILNSVYSTFRLLSGSPMITLIKKIDEILVQSSLFALAIEVDYHESNVYNIHSES